MADKIKPIKVSPAEKHEAFIQFRSDGKIFYKFAYNVKTEKDVEGTLFSVYIPAYDMAFSATNMNDVHDRAKLMVKSFYNYFLHNSGIKQFVLKIHKLGFRAPNHDFVMKNLLNAPNKVKTKFSTEGKLPVPVGFEDGSPNVNIQVVDEEYAM